MNENHPCVFLTGITYNKAKPIPMIAIPPIKDHHPVSNSGKRVRSNTTKPKTITENPSMFLDLDVIGSMFVIYHISLFMNSLMFF